MKAACISIILFCSVPCFALGSEENSDDLSSIESIPAQHHSPTKTRKTKSTDKHCRKCGTNESCQWRKNGGSDYLCNACGIKDRKVRKKRQDQEELGRSSVQDLNNLQVNADPLEPLFEDFDYFDLLVNTAPNEPLSTPTESPNIQTLGPLVATCSMCHIAETGLWSREGHMGKFCSDCCRYILNCNSAEEQRHQEIVKQLQLIRLHLQDQNWRITQNHQQIVDFQNLEVIQRETHRNLQLADIRQQTEQQQDMLKGFESINSQLQEAINHRIYFYPAGVLPSAQAP